MAEEPLSSWLAAKAILDELDCFVCQKHSNLKHWIGTDIWLCSECFAIYQEIKEKEKNT